MLKNGPSQQCAPPQELYDDQTTLRPASSAARKMNLFQSQLRREATAPVRLQFGPQSS